MIRTVIADSQRLVRGCLRDLLQSMHNVQVIGEAEDGEQAVQVARSLSPDIVLLDVIMPGMGGLEATQRITRLDNAARVIALTSCVDAPVPAQMMKAGALGYLTRNIDAAELESALRRVYLGKRYVCNEVAQELANYAFDEHVESPFSILSNREMQIMMMVVNCQKVGEISKNLHLSPKTVNSYRYRIFDKLRISSDVELVLLAVKYGMAPTTPVTDAKLTPPPRRADTHTTSATPVVAGT